MNERTLPHYACSPWHAYADLAKYVMSSGGACDAQQQAPLSCRIPLRGVICGAELIAITATHQQGKLLTIEMKIGSLGC